MATELKVLLGVFVMFNAIYAADCRPVVTTRVRTGQGLLSRHSGS